MSHLIWYIFHFWSCSCLAIRLSFDRCRGVGLIEILSEIALDPAGCVDVRADPPIKLFFRSQACPIAYLPVRLLSSVTYAMEHGPSIGLDGFAG